MRYKHPDLSHSAHPRAAQLGVRSRRDDDVVATRNSTWRPALAGPRRANVSTAGARGFRRESAHNSPTPQLSNSPILAVQGVTAISTASNVGAGSAGDRNSQRSRS